MCWEYPTLEKILLHPGHQICEPFMTGQWEGGWNCWAMQHQPRSIFLYKRETHLDNLGPYPIPVITHIHSIPSFVFLPGILDLCSHSVLTLCRWHLTHAVLGQSQQKIEQATFHSTLLHRQRATKPHVQRCQILICKVGSEHRLVSLSDTIANRKETYHPN